AERFHARTKVRFDALNFGQNHTTKPKFLEVRQAQARVQILGCQAFVRCRKPPVVVLKALNSGLSREHKSRGESGVASVDAQQLQFAHEIPEGLGTTCIEHAGAIVQVQLNKRRKLHELFDDLAVDCAARELDGSNLR